MNRSSIRDALKHQPFKPFVLLMLDGQKFEINSPDVIGISPSQEIAVIFTTNNYHIIDTTKIVSLEIL